MTRDVSARHERVFSRPHVCALFLAAASCVGSCLYAQQIQFGDRVLESKKAHVQLLTQTVEVAAEISQEVELRFRVDRGFHINSHTPKDELLLATSLTLDPLQKGKLLDERYPAGSAFRLQGQDGEPLDVYQNEFRVRLRLIAQCGSTTLTGVLHYQACDSAACFPPRTLPVQVLLTAK